MAPPKQSNTIDFDAAKQKRGPQSGGNASGPRASNLTELRQQLTLQLQSSLEAERILGLFFEEVRQLIPLDALGYRLRPAPGVRQQRQAFGELSPEP